MFSDAVSRVIIIYLTLLMSTMNVNSDSEEDVECSQCESRSSCYYIRGWPSTPSFLNCRCRRKYSYEEKSASRDWTCPCQHCIPKWNGKIGSKIILAKYDIEILPSQIFKRQFQSNESLDNIKTLDLSENKLVKIQAGAFSGLGSLESLQLFQNSFKIVPQSAFEDIPNLKTLNMSRNLIQNLTARQFVQLPKLNFLELKYCEISYIAPNAFYGLKSLTKLLLNGNRLTILGKNTFASLFRLKTLDLSENRINTLETGALIGLPSVELMYFGNNSLNFTSDDWATALGYQINSAPDSSALSEFPFTIIDEDKNGDLNLGGKNTYPCNCYKDGSSCVGLWSVDEVDLNLKCVNAQTKVYRTAEYLTTGVTSALENGKWLFLQILQAFALLYLFYGFGSMAFSLGVLGYKLLEGFYEEYL